MGQHFSAKNNVFDYVIIFYVMYQLKPNTKQHFALVFSFIQLKKSFKKEISLFSLVFMQYRFFTCGLFGKQTISEALPYLKLTSSSR